MDKRETEELLKKQVIEIMQEEQNGPQSDEKQSRKKKYSILKIAGLLAGVILISVLLLVGTKAGRNMIYRAAGKFVSSNVNNDKDNINDKVSDKDTEIDQIDHVDNIRREEYVLNYLIFGIEKIGGASNTDAMMIASINTNDKTIKLSSLLRDSYVEIPGYKADKLNSAYTNGGAELLIETIESNYKIHIDGYASVDFASFEKLIDQLGGITIELGKEEAEYLNKTNYISKKSNRNVKPGVNILNGNQAMGYVRVRKVKTLGGANNDYGRIVRQQRVLKALFESYVSPKNLFSLLSITKDSLGYVTTSLSQKKIEQAIEAVVENKITTLETFRVPVDGAFEAPRRYNGIGYPLVLDWDVNRVELFKFVFGYTEKEAKEVLTSMQN